MPDITPKMHQIRFQLRLRPRPRWGAHSAPPDPVAEFRGRKGIGNDLGEGGNWERKGNGKVRERRKELGGKGEMEG